MTKQTFLRRWGVHLGYWVVILGLGWMIFIQNRGEKDLQQVLLPTLSEAARVLDQHQGQALLSIQRSSMNFPLPENEKYRRNAERADSLSRHFEKVMTLFARDTKAPLAAPQIVLLRQEATVLHLAYQDLTDGSIPLEALPDLLRLHRSDSTGIDHLLQTANLRETMQLLFSVRLRAKMAGLKVLNYCASKISDDSFLDCSNYFEPVSYTRNPAPKVGELYEAEISFGEFSPRVQNLRIRVDGQEFPLREGRIFFQKIYTKAGPKVYTVQVDVVNPLTKEVKTFTRDFPLHVIASGPPEGNSGQ